MNHHHKLVALDFDGVLHSYTSPWTDAATISDGPTPGAMQFLKSLVDDDRFDVVIVSSRCKEPAGVQAIQDWLHHQLAFDGEDEDGPVPRGIDLDDNRAIRVHIPNVQRLLEQVPVISYRPPAFLTIDDRAMTFEGTWPDLNAMAAFRPWNKRPAVDLETRMMLAQSRHGDVPVDDIEAHGFHEATEISRKRDEAEWSDLMRDVARRAYAAGCEAHEFHEADCQDEVRAILDDVLRRKVVEAEYDAEAIRLVSEGIPRRVYPPAVMVEDDERSGS